MVPSLKDQRVVRAAEAEGRAQDDSEWNRPGLAGNIVEVEFRVFTVVERWWDDSRAQSAHANCRLDGRGSAHGVAHRSLDRADRHPPSMVAKDLLHHLGLHFVIDWRAGAVGVVIIDL